MAQPKRRSSREAWILVAFALAIPLAFVGIVTTLALTVEPDSATGAAAYVAGGTWLLALVLHAARTLPATIRGRADSFEPRMAAFAFAGLLACLAVAVVTRYEVVDAATGITGEIVVGAFGVAALLVEIVKRP